MPEHVDVTRAGNDAYPAFARSAVDSPGLFSGTDAVPRIEPDRENPVTMFAVTGTRVRPTRPIVPGRILEQEPDALHDHSKQFVVGACDLPCSLLTWLKRRYPEQSLPRLREWVACGAVTVDGQPFKATRYLDAGQSIAITAPEPRPHPAKPEPLPLPIRHLDAHCVVVAKPAGMATHPGPGWWSGSCVNALLAAIDDWPGINGVSGPGIVHRLDRDTSGLLVFARTDLAHQGLLKAVAQREFERVYLAWVEGVVRSGGSITAPLARDPREPDRMRVCPDGKAAITHYEVVKNHGDRTLLKLRLDTGRNHQIRVHLAHLGHPVLGDRWYGNPGPVLALHALQLGFIHPVTATPLFFEEPPPDIWLRAFGWRE